MKFSALLSLFMLLAVPGIALADCRDCGVVKKIERVNEHHSGTGGMVAGAVVGGVVGNQVGKGDGKVAATVAGAAVGAYAGKKIAENSDDHYRVTVRMNDGRVKVVDQEHLKGVRVGSLVYVRDGRARLR